MPDRSKKYEEEKALKIKRVLEFSSFLEAGLYALDDELRVAFKQSQCEHPVVASLSRRKSRQSLPAFSIESEKSKKFAGTLLWFCSNGDIKIFANTEILIVCSNRKNYESKLANYNYFSPFFTVPELLVQDEAKLQLIEKLIKFEPKSNCHDEFLLRTICRDYTNYFNNMKDSGMIHYRTFNQLLETSPNAIFRKQFELIIQAVDQQLLTISLPFLKLHGDLWRANLLMEKTGLDREKLWYIDWDESGSYLFFYDFFKFMWNELDVNADFSYYHRYLAGDFDQYLTAMFAIFDLEFREEEKVSYFYLFFLNFLLAESSNMSYKVKQNELNDFQEKVFWSKGY